MNRTISSIRSSSILLSLLLLVYSSTRTSAQTGGPVQSDYSGSPVPSGPNVDQFTGRFSYGLPLLTVPGPFGSGYTVSISYASGTNPNDVASWIGYGWSLNAGAIVRETRGFPDDWEDTVIYWNKVPKNYTVTGTPKVNLEILSEDYSDTTGSILGGIGYEFTSVFNNYKGASRRYGFGASMAGIGNLQYEWGDDAGGFTYNIDPGAASTIGKAAGMESSLALNLAGRAFAETVNRAGYSFGDPIRPMDVAPYSGTSWNYSSGILVSIPPILSGIKIGAGGRVTEQTSDVKRAVGGYGYLYSRDAIFTDQTFLDRWFSVDGEVGATGNMDYHRELPFPYRHSNVYLPIPFSSADNFVLTGAAGGGGMRLFSSAAGHFFPHTTKSTTYNIQVGFDLEVLGRWGAGGKFGGGLSTFKTTGWWYDGMGYTNYFPAGEGANQSYFLRFTNDLGGNALFATSDAAVRAGLLKSTSPTSIAIPALSSFINTIQADVADDIAHDPLQLGESRRNIYADFHTITDWKLTTDHGKFYKSYNKRADIRSFIDTYDPKIQKSIGEIAVTGADGSRRVYGLPVFARREKNIRYGLDPDAVGLPTTTIDHNLLASTEITSTNAPTVMGEERDAPYATTYLLTEITTPDYIDVDFNGPSADDIGGWTKFNYIRTAGSNTKSSKSGGGDTVWYSWRYPLNGLLYDKGSLSDGRDNLGSFSSGQHEVYYLESIETKTHIAFFVTNKTDKTYGGRHIEGSGIIRHDGQMSDDVGDLQETTQEKKAAGATATEPVEGRQRRFDILCQLERIELYTKDANGNPDSLLTTVYLEHDHSLRKDLPNAQGTAPRDGLLTLKKVWVQPQGLAPARIQPYEFGYEYRASADYPFAARQRYPEATSYADSLSSTEQNPNYSFFQIDRWGSYQADGEERANRLNPWVDQSPDKSSFDPAAWQLKWVRTPSGGETHVQYEQNEYSYVQDRPAMAMASLLDSINQHGTWYKPSDQNSSNSYFLNLDDLGIGDTDKVTLDRLVSTIEHRYVKEKKNKMFFKFLYALKGTTAGIENSERTSEYITGYVSVYNVTLWQLDVGSPPHYAVEIKLKSEEGEGPVPRKICHEYVRHNRWGLLDPADMIEDRAPANMIFDVIGTFGFSSFNADSYCNDIDYPNSYLRIPMVTPKKGGGVRVRRLLTLDPGNEGDSALYGTEYLYETYDEDRHELIGSGVATNEPPLGREENALIEFHSLPERSELDHKSIYGDDKARYESPLGESVLPGPFVGYSRVVASSIHTGKTNPGFSVGEFFTTKDYPFDKAYDQGEKGADYTGIGSYSVTSPPNTNGAAESADSAGHYVVGAVFSSDKTYLTQGYRFILNSMNGQPKSSTAYGGRYDDPASWYMSSSTSYTYYEPGDSIPMLRKVGEPVYYDNPGKEMDVAMESRATLENLMNLRVQADVSGFFGELQFSGAAEGRLSNSELYTHVTNKVIHYPAYLKSVLSYGDGVYHLSENVAFSPETGSPLVTKTYDSHNGLNLAGTAQVGTYHNYVFPASVEYPELGQKAANGRALLSTTVASAIKVYYDTPDYLKFSGPSACRFVNTLTPGDLLMLRKKADGALAGFFHVGGVDRDSVWLIPVASAFATEVIGVIDEVDVEVLESGRRNQMAASVGSLTTYGENTSDIVAGTNVTRWEPSGTTARQQLAALLNTTLQAGGGLIYPAAIDTLGLQFIDPETSECDSLRETLRLELSDDGLTVTRGTFSFTDTVCGTPSTPHPMVDWLNNYLDAIWGYEVPASHESALSVCNNTDLWEHLYTERPQGYIDLQNSYLNHEFDCVDGYKVPRNINQYLQLTVDDDLNAGFRTDSTSLYKATGPFYLDAVTNSDFLTVYAVADCDGYGALSQMRLRRQWLFGMNVKDSTSYYNTPSAADFSNIDSYTTDLGTFEEDSNGYLTYHDLHGGNTPYRAFGIRFHKLDTIPQDVVCEQRYPTSGGIGSFDIDQYGRLIYRCGDGTCPPHVISCLEFCPDSELRVQDTIHGVIAASAAILDDHDPYRTEDMPSSLTSFNDYERGLRGRWRPRTSFLYRTATKGGAEVSAGERNYKNAGVYNSFTLFDWNNPTANDRTHWVRLDTVTRYSPYGQALETKDRLGIYSTIKYDPTGRLPKLVAANSDYGSVGFEDFEHFGNDDSSSTFAHSGLHSLKGTPGTDEITMGVRLTDRLREKGALIRFWGKGMGDGDDVDVRLAPETQPLQNLNVGVNRIAQTGEWTLYEATATDFSGMTPTGDLLVVSFVNSTSDTIYIDDIRIQPTDAEMICYSYDSKTMRPLVTFDANHFGTYTQYNAEGTPVRTIVETVRGYKTVADAYGHLPSQPRTGEGSLARPGGDVPTRLRAGSGGPSAPSIGGANSGSTGTKFDLLNVELSADRQEVKTIGGGSRSIPDLVAPNVPSLELPAFSAARYTEMLAKLDTLNRQTAGLESAARDTLTRDERLRVTRELNRLKKQRRELLRSYGVDEGTLEELRRRLHDTGVENSNEQGGDRP